MNADAMPNETATDCRKSCTRAQRGSGPPVDVATTSNPVDEDGLLPLHDRHRSVSVSLGKKPRDGLRARLLGDLVPPLGLAAAQEHQSGIKHNREHTDDNCGSCRVG